MRNAWRYAPMAGGWHPQGTRLTHKPPNVGDLVAIQEPGMTTLTVGTLLAAAAICDCSGKGESHRIADAPTAEARRLHAEAQSACYIDLPFAALGAGS